MVSFIFCSEETVLEYSVALGNDLRGVWAGEILPLLDMIRHSPYFWPVVVAVGVIILFVARQILK